MYVIITKLENIDMYSYMCRWFEYLTFLLYSRIHEYSLSVFKSFTVAVDLKHLTFTAVLTICRHPFKDICELVSVT